MFSVWEACSSFLAGSCPAAGQRRLLFSQPIDIWYRIAEQMEAWHFAVNSPQETCQEKQARAQAQKTARGAKTFENRAFCDILSACGG